MQLITGGMGFIGLHTARRFLDMGEEVVLTQFRVAREPDFIKDDLGKGAQVAQLDVSNPYAVMEVVHKYPITGIVHLAVPGLGALSAGEDYRTNMMGLLNVLEAARVKGVNRLSIASSIGAYGSLKEGPYSEDLPLPVTSGNPTEAYKKAMEILSFHYADRTKLDVISLRIGGIWGPLYHSMANLPSRLTHAAVRGTAPNFAGARGGTPMADDSNDMCYVKDCAAGIVAIQTAGTLNHRIYNIGWGRATTNRQLADAVNKAVPGANITLPDGKSANAKPNNYMTLDRTTADTGYRPTYEIEGAVADYAEWLRHNPQ